MPIRQRLLAPTVSMQAQRGRAARWAAIWGVLACQEEENLDVLKVNPRECIPESIVEQSTNSQTRPTPGTSEIVVSSDEAGFVWPGADDTTSTDVTAVTIYAGEARSPGITMHSASTASGFAVPSGYSSSDEDEAGSSWTRTNCTTSTAATAAVAKLVGEVRPPGIAKHSEFRGDRIEADMTSFMSRLDSLRLSVGEAGSLVSSHTFTSASTLGLHAMSEKENEKEKEKE